MTAADDGVDEQGAGGVPVDARSPARPGRWRPGRRQAGRPSSRSPGRPGCGGGSRRWRRCRRWADRRRRPGARPRLNARRVATIQTTVCRRLTGMPSRAARSARSADARMAMPTSVRRRKTARAIITSGATIRAATSSAPKISGSMVKRMSQGRSRAWAWGRSPHRRGRSRAHAPRRVASPMVATVRMSRGASKKRRMMASSTMAPTTTADEEAGAEAQPVVDPGEGDQVHADRGGDAAEVGLGEVDDPVGPVDEGQAERGQRARGGRR